MLHLMCLNPFKKLIVKYYCIKIYINGKIKDSVLFISGYCVKILFFELYNVIEREFALESNETIIDKFVADGNKIVLNECSPSLIDSKHELTPLLIVYICHHIQC